MSQLSVMIPDRQTAALKVIARRGHRSMASVVRELLERVLADVLAERKAKRQNRVQR